MLRAVFYARFHPERGPCIVHQYPPDSIIATASSADDNDDDNDGRLMPDFSDVSPYIIPPHEVCNRPLSICINSLRILGFPISLEDTKYERNRFIFNVCFVFDEDTDTEPWEPIVKKTAQFFQQLEEQEERVLHAEETLADLRWAGEEHYPARNVGTLYPVLEAIVEQLNAYGEACVRVDDAHILNLRLARTKPAPPAVRAWDVPLLIRSIPNQDHWSPDLILSRVLPYIDGIRHVQRIGEVADVDRELVAKAVQDLLYNNYVLLLDIFHFQAVYSTTEDFAWFVQDKAMLEECCAYVATSTAAKPHRTTILTLYRHLSVGQSLEDFCRSYSADLAGIDIRRLITFGVLKGFLRRLHKYPLAVDSKPSTPRPANGASQPALAKSVEFYDEAAWRTAAFSSGWPTPPANHGTNEARGSVERMDDSVKLAGFLDGTHCMDEICVAMRMSEKQVIAELRNGKFGDVMFVCK